MALIKNDITLSNEKIENVLKYVDDYLKLSSDEMKLYLSKNIKNYFYTYVNAFFDIINKGKNVDSIVNFYNFSNEQVLKLTNSVAKGYNNIVTSYDNFEINYDAEILDMIEKYLNFYDIIFEKMSEYVENYGLELKNNKNVVDEISENITSCISNRFSKGTKEYFFENFEEYLKIIEKIKIKIKEHFNDILQNNISAPQL